MRGPFLLVVLVVGLAAACATHDSLDLAGGSPTPTPLPSGSASATPSASPTASAPVSAPPLVAGQVGTGATAAAVTSLLVTLPRATTDANLLVVAVGSTGPGLPSVTDDAGNAWSKVSSSSASPTGNRVTTFYARDSFGSATPAFTITLPVDKPGKISALVAEFAGLSLTSPQGFSAGTLGSDAAPSAGSTTPTIQNALILGVLTHDAANTTTPGAGFSMAGIAADDGATRVPLAVEYLQYSLGSGSISVDFALASSDGWGAMLVVFRP